MDLNLPTEYAIQAFIALLFSLLKKQRKNRFSTKLLFCSASLLSNSIYSPSLSHFDSQSRSFKGRERFLDILFPNTWIRVLVAFLQHLFLFFHITVSASHKSQL
ncbi:hypothetical protein V6Z11_A12G236300 [Gossypium hirsutum]